MKPASVLAAAMHLLILWFGARPALGQAVICCSQIYDVGGNWIGASRTCDLSSLPPDKRAKLCQQLAGCPQAAPHCGVEQPSTVCGSIVDVQNQALGEAIRIGGDRPDGR